MIIDDRGRIFGKVNILDLLAVIFLLFCLPIFFVGYRLAKKKFPPPVTVVIPKWECVVKCKYCGFDMPLKLMMKESPPERGIKRVCERCGKKQMAFYGFKEVKPIVDTACQEKLEWIFKAYPRLRRKFK